MGIQDHVGILGGPPFRNIGGCAFFFCGGGGGVEGRVTFFTLEGRGGGGLGSKQILN